VGQYPGYIARPLEKREIAANGGYACQITNDSFTNQPPDFDGYRMRQFLIGAAVTYTIEPLAKLTI
jgi:hypothetical protein